MVPADITNVPQTLLLADDSVTIQRVIELTFADEDIKVIAVSDGDQAIAQLDATPPDIVLADIGMPGRNGYEVARYVKQSPRLAHIPVVLLTGAFEPVDQVRATEAGCDGILAKPFAPQLVINRVQQLLAGRQRASAALDDTAAERADATSPAGSPPPTFESAPPSERAAAAQATDRPTPSPLAEAFAALFAAEHGTPPIDATPAAQGPAIDDIVEQVSRRVLALLHERVVRETV